MLQLQKSDKILKSKKNEAEGTEQLQCPSTILSLGMCMYIMVFHERRGIEVMQVDYRGTGNHNTNTNLLLK